jgi:deazaflavin-dependent oxidoreductase (nitroreductase family)
MKMSRVLERVVRYFNPVTRLVLATPLHVVMSSRLLLLSFTGRKTGRSYTTPVSYVLEGSSLLVPGGGAWWKNLGSGRPTRVRLRGVWTPVTPEVVTEPVALAEVMRRMLAANPAIGAFTGIRLGSDGRPDADALERERRRGFVVVRLRLAEGDAQRVY